MDKIIRRQALQSIGGGSLAALFLGAGQAVASDRGTAGGGVLAQGTLTLEHTEGRRMSGFLETGIADGIALCNLVRQDPDNPAVLSVFAAPERRGDASGVRVTVSLYSEPVGDVTFNLMHLAVPLSPTPVERA